MLEFPSTYARTDPDRAAVVDDRTGATLTYRQLEDRSRAFAHELLRRGLRAGDHLALVAGNRTEFFEICWAAHRIGLYYTAVNTHLTSGETKAIIADCGAKVLVVDRAPGSLGQGLPAVEHRIGIDAPAGYEPYEPLASAPAGPLPAEQEGEKMLYSSGTTGVPKGVVRPLTGGPPGSVFLIRPLMVGRLGFGPASVFLSPAPLYHSAPLGYSMGVHRLGGTVVLDGRFDPARCLSAIARHRVTHALFVPTMFSRMLRLPESERAAHDLSSLAVAVHGAAPCPPAVKHAMIDWWGPVLFEYYAGTEGAGMTLIDSAEWRAHPGSVGRPVSGDVHIVDEQTGVEVGPNATGTVYFSGGAQFRYHNDAAKTAASYGPNGWNTLGDIGHRDEDGYVYLTDRKAFTVISGGVNIYPQQTENVLAGHPAVADVAAFGVPQEDLGEELVALVELADPAAAGNPTAAELVDWCRARLAHQSCPRRLEFRDHLPRAENGKLYKRQLRTDFLSGQNAASHAASRKDRTSDGSS